MANVHFSSLLVMGHQNRYVELCTSILQKEIYCGKKYTKAFLKDLVAVESKFQASLIKFHPTLLARESYLVLC